MANRDHKAGPRPSLADDGSQTPSPHDPDASGLDPTLPYDPQTTALRVLTYLRDRLEKREWLVISGMPGDPIVGSLTSEMSAALDIAVHCIELSAGAPSHRRVVNA
ncbi:hypothetical protein SAMN04487785_11877 [Dyella jiangningensis]|uniref:hypothetical protein n=1 Tax=Dyella sp. AtDHG13 TaxID=1938897 RepID=UPI00088BA7D6|nr:hypothetical protein [Dyella sp. AtDHG13]PXV53255.1 hypothetical protein BDW41_11512 [Dyella sp. AtDHG13]SDL36740.1 hypothetical protein SAMN04487785_11877 [Dyella jiangningensis]